MQLGVRYEWLGPGGSAAAGAGAADSITAAAAAAFLSCGAVELLLLLLHVFALACVVQQPAQDSLAGREQGQGRMCVEAVLLECGM